MACILITQLAWAQENSTLPAGTRLWVRLETCIATKSARIGDAVEATLVDSIQRDGRILVPSGSRLRGRVDDVRRADKAQGLVAQLRLDFIDLEVAPRGPYRTNASVLDVGSGQQVDANGVITTAKHKDVANSLGAGTLLGGLVGLLVSRTDKAIIVGGLLGAASFGLAEATSAGPEWQDFEFKRGRRVWLKLNTDTMLP